MSKLQSVQLVDPWTLRKMSAAESVRRQKTGTVKILWANSSGPLCTLLLSRLVTIISTQAISAAIALWCFSNWLNIHSQRALRLHESQPGHQLPQLLWEFVHVIVHILFLLTFTFFIHILIDILFHKLIHNSSFSSFLPFFSVLFCLTGYGSEHWLLVSDAPWQQGEASHAPDIEALDLGCPPCTVPRLALLIHGSQSWELSLFSGCEDLLCCLDLKSLSLS